MFVYYCVYCNAEGKIQLKNSLLKPTQRLICILEYGVEYAKKNPHTHQTCLLYSYDGYRCSLLLSDNVKLESIHGRFYFNLFYIPYAIKNTTPLILRILSRYEKNQNLLLFSEGSPLTGFIAALLECCGPQFEHFHPLLYCTLHLLLF